MFHGIMSDFFSFLLFKFTFIIKLRNFDLASQWNTQKIVKKMISDWNMSCQRVSNLVLVSLFERNFENKLTITNFQVYWTSLIILNWVTCCQIKLYLYFLTSLQMDVAQYFTLYLFWLINDSILKSMIPIENGILLKNHVSCNLS